MALYVLESCVAWDKSIMKAVRSVVGSFLEDGVRVCVYNVLSTTHKVHKSLGLCVCFGVMFVYRWSFVVCVSPSQYFSLYLVLRIVHVLLFHWDDVVVIVRFRPNSKGYGSFGFPRMTFILASSISTGLEWSIHHRLCCRRLVVVINTVVRLRYR